MIKHREACGSMDLSWTRVVIHPCGPSMSSWREERLLQKAFWGCSFVPSCPQRMCFLPLMYNGAWLHTWKLELAGEFPWQESCSIFWAPRSSCNCTFLQILPAHLQNAEVEEKKKKIINQSPCPPRFEQYNSATSTRGKSCSHSRQSCHCVSKAPGD